MKIVLVMASKFATEVPPNFITIILSMYLFILALLTHTAVVVRAGMIVFLFCDGFEKGDVVGYGRLEIRQKNVFFRTMGNQD